MDWFELGYTIGILMLCLSAISSILYLLIRQRRRDKQRRKDVKEGKAKRRFWRDMP